MRRLTFLAAGFMLLSGAAHAATVPCGKFDITVNPSSTGTCLAGNDTGANGISQTDTLFQKTGWVFSQKINDAGADDTGQAAGVQGDRAITFDNKIVDGGSMWSLIDASIADFIMITIKQSNNIAAFLIDIGASSGTWEVAKDGNVIQDISHSAVFYIPKDGSDPTDPTDPNDPNDPPSPVPLPAAGWLLLGTLGGLAAMRRGRKRA
ncbi:MAG: VPLPA-CTERM sorting domain-containing protein [Pseudomonadota bacterium]